MIPETTKMCRIDNNCLGIASGCRNFARIFFTLLCFSKDKNTLLSTKNSRQFFENIVS